MDAFGGGGGHGGFWGMRPFHSKQQRGRGRGRGRGSKPSDSAEVTGGSAGYRFPLKQAVTAASLTLTGDTIAQLLDRYNKTKTLQQQTLSDSHESLKDLVWNLHSEHDWLRVLRMTSYGFLLYGPGSYAWYQLLERIMPKQTVQNLLIKPKRAFGALSQTGYYCVWCPQPQVLLNQVILGPCVIAVVFAWNYSWQGKVSELPKKYQKDAIPTLLFGFRFWIPVSVLNFWVVPLQARVAFMSLGSIFWNSCLSATMSK